MPSPAAPAAPEFTCDQLGRHRIWQPARGYRFSIDSVLLADFAPRVRGPVADLGAGCGVLCLLLAARGMKGPFTAVELDPLAAECCRRNFAQAGLEGVVLEQDLARPAPELSSGGFALVISNPPFTRRGHGRVPPDPARARARHELSLEAPVLWESAARLLPPGGRLALCCPPARLDEVLAGLAGARLRPKRLRLVHGRLERPASLALVEAAKDGRPQLTVEPPLVVYGRGQEYSPQTAAIYQRLCGPFSPPA